MRGFAYAMGLTERLGIDAIFPLTKTRERFERAKMFVNKRIAKITEEVRRSL